MFELTVIERTSLCRSAGRGNVADVATDELSVKEEATGDLMR
jgi:hypothetical protein